MHTLIAFMLPLFSAIVHPVSGGELEWVHRTASTPLRLAVNGDLACTVDLTKSEAIDVAETMLDIIDNGAPGKAMMMLGGDTVEVLDAGGGSVRFETNGLLGCAVTLLADHHEPDKVIEIFFDAAGA